MAQKLVDFRLVACVCLAANFFRAVGMERRPGTYALLAGASVSERGYSPNRFPWSRVFSERHGDEQSNWFFSLRRSGVAQHK
jgi:hypothetical protein